MPGGGLNRMNLLLSLVTAAFFAVAPINQSVAQTVNDELVIAVTKVSPKNLNEIVSTLQQIDGVTVDSFCPQHACFMLYIDRGKQPDNALVISKIGNIVHPTFVHIKTGTIAAAKESCEDLDNLDISSK